jgi:Flp pilus assembly protein TadB
MSLLVFLSTFLVVVAIFMIIRDRKQSQIERVRGTDFQVPQVEKDKREKQKKKAKGIAAQLQKAGINRNPYEWAAIVFVVSLTCGVIVFVLVKGFFFALLGALAGPFLTRGYIKKRINNRSEQMAEQLKPTLRSMANLMHGQKQIAQALEISIQDAEEPLKSELQMIYMDILEGATPAEAFVAAQKRIPVKEFTTIALGVRTSEITGSDLSETFYNATKMITKRQEGKEKAYTYTQGIRTQGTAGTVFLVIIFLFMRFVFKDFYISALKTFMGQAVLFGFMALVIIVNIYIKRKLDNIEF